MDDDIWNPWNERAENSASWRRDTSQRRSRTAEVALAEADVEDACPDQLQPLLARRPPAPGMLPPERRYAVHTSARTSGRPQRSTASPRPMRHANDAPRRPTSWHVPARRPALPNSPHAPDLSEWSDALDTPSRSTRSAPDRFPLRDRSTRIVPTVRQEPSAAAPSRDRSTRIVPAARLGLPDRPTRIVPAARRVESVSARAATPGDLQSARATQIIPAVRPATEAPVARWLDRRGMALRSAVSLALAAVVIAGFIHLWMPHSLDTLGSAVDVLDSGSAFAGAGSSDASAPWVASAAAIPVLGAGGAAAPGVHAPGTAGIPVKGRTPPTPTSAPATYAAPATSARTSSSSASGVLPAPFWPWPPSNPWMWVPGHTPYALAEPNPDPFKVAWGQCTWWAQHERPDENLRNMGNALAWAYNAPHRGLHVGSTPVAGATAVFQPGVQGAGGYGHVAHVMAVYPNGWFLVSEMNAYGNGGGFGRVSFRYAHAGAGVSFIY